MTAHKNVSTKVFFGWFVWMIFFNTQTLNVWVCICRQTCCHHFAIAFDRNLIERETGNNENSLGFVNWMRQSINWLICTRCRRSITGARVRTQNFRDKLIWITMNARVCCTVNDDHLNVIQFHGVPKYQFSSSKSVRNSIYGNGAIIPHHIHNKSQSDCTFPLPVPIHT